MLKKLKELMLMKKKQGKFSLTSFSPSTMIMAVIAVVFFTALLPTVITQLVNVIANITAQDAVAGTIISSIVYIVIGAGVVVSFIGLFGLKGGRK